MRLFEGCKGYASEATALKKLTKVLPDYDTYRWTIVFLPNGRFLPVMQISGDPRIQHYMGMLAFNNVGVM